jgi:hypothetical protein
VSEQIGREQTALAAACGHVTREGVNENADARGRSEIRALRDDACDDSGEHIAHAR